MSSFNFLKHLKISTKKVISIISAFAILLSLVVTPIATRAENTEKMFVVSPNATGETKYANVFVPLDFLEVDGKRLHSQENDEYYYFKLEFKLKLIGEKMPIVGIIRYAYWNQGGQSEFNYVNNNQDSHEDTLLYSKYDEDTLTYTALIKMWINPDPNTGVHTALTIGNMEHNNSWHKENNFTANYAFTSPTLYAYNTSTNSTFGENLLPEITENNFTGNVFKHPSNGYKNSDALLKAPANKWSIDTTSSLISLEDIPEGYFTPSKHKYTKVPIKAPTRTEVGYKEHYVCSCEDCTDKYFLDKGITEVTLQELEIPPIGEDKMVVISPNVEGGTKFANVFIPINFREAGGKYLKGENYYFKLTFKARLFGDKLPIVGVMRYNPYNNLGSWSEPNNAKNNQESYSHTDEVIYSEYNEESMTFTAVVKIWINDNYCTSPTGAYAAIMIGNAEHNDAWYSEHNFDTHFAFGNPELYFYDKNKKEAVGENLIAPIAESTINFDKAYKHTKNDYNGEDNIMAAPANMWSIDGEKNLVRLCDYPEGYLTPGVHNFVEHPAKEATITQQGNLRYFTCDCEHCEGKYFSDQGLTEVAMEDIIITKKMIVVSPNSSGGTKIANAFIPLNFRKSGGVTFNENNYYFKLTFKLKILGNSMPIVGMIRYNPYNNLGSWSEFNNANNNQLDHSDQVIYSEYDPETMIFTAVVKTWISDKYSSSPTGAHTAITIGNAEHNNSWRSEYNFDASFAFADPKLYAYNAETGTTYGENLIADITDATFYPEKVYQHPNNDYAGEDNIMSAPANMWCIDGQRNMISLSDIPDNYFVPTEGKPHMVIYAGRNDSEGKGKNGRIFQKVKLEANKKYQLSYNAKYAGEGIEGDKSGGLLEYYTDGSYKELNAVKTESAGEYKEIFNFTMPEDAASGSNFRFTFNYSSGFTSGYMANFELYELDAQGNTIGGNLFKNGDFSIGGVSMWNKQGESYQFIVSDIPENFFSKTNPVKSNMVIYRNTSDYAQIMQMPMLKPNTTYEYSHTALHTDYAADKKPYSIIYEFYHNADGKVENASIAKDRIKETTNGAKTTMVFTTLENLRVTGDNNSIFRLYMRSDSAGYWGLVELYELDKNGKRVGNNILLNPDFTSGLSAWSVTGDSTLRAVETPDNFFKDYKEPENMVYSNGKTANQAYSSTLKVSADKKHYFSGFYVNMNSVGVKPQIKYLAKNGEYKIYDKEAFYDSDRYYFELLFETPEDALVTNGKITICAQMDNKNKGKGYFTELMLTEEDKYLNLLTNFTYGNSGNFEFMKYDPEVFVFYYDDTKFDDGDWSGELSENAFDIKYGRITGVVVDAEWNGIANQTMKLKPGNITVKTDEVGSYIFDELTPGNYKLYFVEKEKSELFCMDVEVKKGIESMLPLIRYYKENVVVEDETPSQQTPTDDNTSSEQNSSNDDTTSSSDTITDNNSSDNNVSTPEINIPVVDIPPVEDNIPSVDEEQPSVETDTTAYGVMRGFYYTTKGKTISGATIYLRNHGSSVTDSDGMFMFENVIPGEYELYTVLNDGKEYILRKVTIEANKGIQVKVMEPILEKESQFPWVIVIVSGAVVLLAGTALTIILILKKKKIKS